MSETQVTINRWIEKTFGTAGSNLSVAARANEEMAELLMALAIDDDHPKAVEECADIVICLYRLVERRGADLHAAIDAKMAINRHRQWNIANGHGRHIQEAST
jgi:phosphoribosyl-ATP pyrophosphohydrolase